MELSLSDSDKNKRIKVIVRPNSPKTKIIGYDKEKKAYRLNVKAQPEKGKANLEVVKFFTKLLKKENKESKTNRKIRIVSGLKSREKVLMLE